MTFQAISSDELLTIQSDMNQFLPSVCRVISDVEVRDSRGGTTITAGVPGPEIRCRIGDPRGQEELTAADKLQDVTVWAVTLPAGTVIDHEDRISVDSIEFRVVHAPLRHDYPMTQRVLVVEA